MGDHARRAKSPIDPEILSPWEILDYQQGVHRAGALARLIRYGCAVLLILFVLARAFAAGELRLRAPPPDSISEHGLAVDPAEGPRRLFILVYGTALGVICGGVPGLAAGFCLAFLYRRLGRWQLRRRFEGIREDQRARALCPLRNLDDDTGLIADQLVREMRLDRYANEVTPAEAPEGRGDELSPIV